MKKIMKKLWVIALSLTMVFGVATISVNAANGTYTFPSLSQSGNNNSTLRYYVTDENEASISIMKSGNDVQLRLTFNEGWYFEKWDTYFNGYEDRAILSDPKVTGSNPKKDGYYTFFNLSQFQPFTNDVGPSGPIRLLFIKAGTGYYGDHRVEAVLRPILTVNAGEGINYQVSTIDPLMNGLSSHQVAVKYGGDAKITYSVDDNYIVTSVSANYATQYDDNGEVVSVSSIIKPATITINSRLKQQIVYFDANEGSGSMASQVFDYGEEDTLNQNTFEREGYTFTGWSTNLDGSGINYTNEQLVSFVPTKDGESITLYAQWEKNVEDYIVSFDSNGGESIEPITVTYGQKYGKLPSSGIVGLSGGNSNWYLVDENGNVTDTKITNLKTVEQTRNHTLFVKRNVLAPTVKLTLSVPGGISDSYNYYIPGNSTRILTASINNENTEVLDYKYEWYKDGNLIENENGAVLTLDGNVADAGSYKVVVTATLKEESNIITTVNTASGENELKVKILHAANELKYDANGGEGGPSANYTGGMNATVSSEVPTREHYIFQEWNTMADGSGDSYAANSTYTFVEDGGNGGCVTTLYAQWEKNVEDYIVSFDSNGGESIEPITVTYGQKYGKLPSSGIVGLSGGNSNWYLVDENGNVTDTKITNLKTVEQTRNHTLFVKRNVLAPSVKLTLSVPGGISDSYNYYIPGNSTRILTASINNENTEVLDYKYEWYKDGNLIENENGAVLTLDGNVADAGSYKVVVTATLKEESNIITTVNTASGENELKVKILHAANELKYDANGGEGGPSANYTGGMNATVSSEVPTREHYIFQEWNTMADGSGDSYAANSTYTFVEDGGNGGCVTTLYAQWKGEKKTVTYMVDNEVFDTQEVEYGKDVVLPEVPKKEGYLGKWDHDGKMITEDITINAVYTKDTMTPQIPQTGDHNNPLLYTICLFISAVALFGAVTLNRKNEY